LSAAQHFPLVRGSFEPSADNKQSPNLGTLNDSKMNILGINAYYSNASAALVCDGKLVAAVEEERFNRVKYAAGFPAAAIRCCLKEAGFTLADLDHVAVLRNPISVTR